MNLIIRIMKKYLNHVYDRYKREPLRNQVTMFSRQSDEPGVDLLMLKDALEREAAARGETDFQAKILCRFIGSGLGAKIRYFRYMKQVMMREMAASRVAVLDSYCIPASILTQREELLIIQMWHAMGAFKKFGYAAIGEREGRSSHLAKDMDMHRNYDYVLVSSEICKPLLEPAYRCGIGKMEVYPLPRTDFIRMPEYAAASRKKILRAYPELAPDSGKKNILYAPTFRKGRDNVAFIRRIIEKVDYADYNFIVKTHPIMAERIPAGNALVDETFSSLEMLSVADYVITDYSAFILEAAVAGKPIYRYVPDRADYEDGRGFFIDMDAECPGFSSEDPQAVLDAIRRGDDSPEEVRRFAEKYVAVTDHCTENLARFILDARKPGKRQP